MSALDTLRTALFGSPPVPEYKPSREGTLAAFQQMEARIDAATLNMASYANVAALPAGADVGTQARVYDDATASNNTVWIKKAGGWEIDQDYIDALLSVVQPVVDSAIEARDEAIAAAFNVPLTIGKYLGTGSTFAGANDVFALGSPFQGRWMLTGGRIKSQVSGDVKFQRIARKVNRDGTLSFRVGSVITVPVSSGDDTFTLADIEAANAGQTLVGEAGEFCGFRSTAGTRLSPSREPYHVWTGGGDVSTTSQERIFAYGASGATFDIELYFKCEEPDKDYLFGILDDMRTFTAIPNEWSNGAGATVSGGKIVFPAGTFASQLNFGRPYGLSQRSMIWDIEFTASNTVMTFQTNPAAPADSGQLEGSLFSILRGTNELWVYDRYDGAGAVPNIDNVNKIPLVGLDGSAIVLAMNHPYTVRVDKIDFDYRITISDPNGSVMFTHLVDNGENTYTAARDHWTKYGMLHGAPSIACTQGTMNLLNWRHVANVRRRPDWLVFGDSLTEPFAVDADEGYVALLAEELGADNVAKSGVGGSDTRGAIVRAFSELLALWPRRVLYNLGSNPGDTTEYQANMEILIRLARNVGAEVFVATVGGSSARSTIVEALVDKTTVRFGSATMSAGPGSTALAGYYAGIRPDNATAFNDGLHGNAFWHLRNYEQLKRDAALALSDARK